MNDAHDGALALLSGKGVPAFLKTKYDPSSSAIFGVSAGGYITAHVSLLLANESKVVGGNGTWKVQTQVLIVPMAVPFGGTESMVRYREQGFHRKAQRTKKTFHEKYARKGQASEKE